jgi:hypothetical protein
MSIARPASYRAAAEKTRAANEAETLARVTGSVAATVTHEHVTPEGEVVTDSVESWSREEEVTKYDELWVIEREDGLRWSASSRTWVTEESNDFTSWAQDEPVLAVHGVDLATRDGGDWRNINEV